MTRIVSTLFFLLAVCIAHPTAAQQTLDHKLEQKTQFKPKAEATLDQLMEVAKTFEIPMGIEWNDSANCKNAGLPAEATVRELLNAIVQRCSGHRLAVGKGVVHVYSRFARHRRNILNLRLWNFEVKQANVFDAEFELKLTIDIKLHPERYKGGWNGGYGSPSDHPFSVENITVSGRNISVRNVLDSIVTSNGNALWVVRLSTASLDVPLARAYKNMGEIGRALEFYPLKDTRQP